MNKGNVFIYLGKISLFKTLTTIAKGFVLGKCKGFNRTKLAVKFLYIVCERRIYINDCTADLLEFKQHVVSVFLSELVLDV